MKTNKYHISLNNVDQLSSELIKLYSLEIINDNKHSVVMYGSGMDCIISKRTGLVTVYTNLK